MAGAQFPEPAPLPPGSALKEPVMNPSTLLHEAKCLFREIIILKDKEMPKEKAKQTHSLPRIRLPPNQEFLDSIARVSWGSI